MVPNLNHQDSMLTLGSEHQATLIGRDLDNPTALIDVTSHHCQTDYTCKALSLLVQENLSYRALRTLSICRARRVAPRHHNRLQTMHTLASLQALSQVEDADHGCIDSMALREAKPPTVTCKQAAAK